MSEKKVVLIILDGYGHSDSHEDNAIFMAKKPVMDKLMGRFPHALLETSGRSVGLPDGVMGNSEVGHLNIGGGRIIKQELTKIAEFAQNKGFDSLPDIKRLFTGTQGALHIMGLVSDGGVHSHQEHLYLLLENAKKAGVKKPIYIHVITDGRDTPPKSAIDYVQALEKVILKVGIGQIASVCGRYFMMDRDKRWDRTELAYKSLIRTHQCLEFKTGSEAVKDAYAKGETDEFIKPRWVAGAKALSAEDGFIFFNFRADRARQICRALAIVDFKEFETPVKLNPLQLVTFTSYEEAFPFPVLFKPSKYENLLGEIVAKKGFKQLRIAETEKYAHVTYFFNGGEEKVYLGEDRILIPSPKEVPTYDLKPEMSAVKVTDELLKKLQTVNYKLVVLNFANSDMVGHTGDLNAAIKAVETIDQCLGRIFDFASRHEYDLFITADHGNSECMVDPLTKNPHTAHTTNPVPVIWCPAHKSSKKLKDGILADVAPTILEIFGWDQPKEMTGQSLLV
ncbi:MAG: 2,3-bisphosphoglycerate-independent phosphoglycerate mutase [Oligoflexia bacterium]|nr:2,3-bisphosphoglycerate-independent phosphoglycerate mutase [Oligoflexia bacterium]